MELVLKRKWLTDLSVIGELYDGDEMLCYTIEDPPRAKKVFGETGIPTGKYKVTVTYSPRFKRALPLLLEVPHFEGVRIHPGNTHEDTEGCILPGKTRGPDFVGRSKEAFNDLYKKITGALDDGEKVTIEIVDET